jgi:hypothetical protein
MKGFGIRIMLGCNHLAMTPGEGKTLNKEEMLEHLMLKGRGL